MPDPAILRDSTQIVLSSDALGDLQPEVEDQFTVTIVERCGLCRIVASPTVIKRVGDFLVRHGVSVP